MRGVCGGYLFRSPFFLLLSSIGIFCACWSSTLILIPEDIRFGNTVSVASKELIRQLLCGILQTIALGLRRGIRGSPSSCSSTLMPGVGVSLSFSFLFIYLNLSLLRFQRQRSRLLELIPSHYCRLMFMTDHDIMSLLVEYQADDSDMYILRRGLWMVWRRGIPQGLLWILNTVRLLLYFTLLLFPNSFTGVCRAP